MRQEEETTTDRIGEEVVFRMVAKTDTVSKLVIPFLYFLISSRCVCASSAAPDEKKKKKKRKRRERIKRN